MRRPQCPFASAKRGVYVEPIRSRAAAVFPTPAEAEPRRTSRIQRHQRRHLGGVAPKLVAHRAEKQEGRGPGAPLAAKAEAGARHSVTCRETARKGSPVAY